MCEATTNGTIADRHDCSVWINVGISGTPSTHYGCHIESGNTRTKGGQRNFLRDADVGSLRVEEQTMTTPEKKKSGQLAFNPSLNILE